jgi:phosphoribosylformimino-5-aminoimidazole carboxamide ribotide isomerase
VILLPAVDIRGGRAVRLRQGHFDDETVYNEDPLEAARAFCEAGADYLHVVDLDGARDGEPANLSHLERIKTELPVTVQYGGGLRSVASVGSALIHGADRVVLGTAAFRDRDFLERALVTWGSRVVVAIDVRGGELSVGGWTESTGAAPEAVIRELQRLGASLFIYTNADRDGMLEGPDLDEVRRIGSVVRGSFLYSGGISSLDDLRALKDLRLHSLAGVIAGKALYEARFTVGEARDALAVTI